MKDFIIYQENNNLKKIDNIIIRKISFIAYFILLDTTSLIYKVDKTLKTYAWIIATPLSNNLKVINRTSKIINTNKFTWLLSELNKVNRRCPATILAANRTDKVKGRITLLINSITTIKGINATGVPVGTKWASIKLGCLIHLIITCPTHKGIAKETDKVKWLDLGNI